MQSTFFVDSHAHIYLPGFEAELEATMLAADEAGVRCILMPAIDATTHEQMLAVASKYHHCKSMMGLHPCYVKENFEKEIFQVEKYLDSQPFIAVGEIGLDFYWDVTFKQQQYEAFRRQLQLALQYNLPVSIHSRNATDECIVVVQEFPGIRGVFHCFSGDVVQAKQITDLGMMLGIGGVVTFKNSGLDKVITEVGLSSVVLETDAPYLAPVPYRGKRNQPAYLKFIAEKLAVVLNLTVEEVAATTTANAEKLFGLKVKP